ncbi:flavin-binding monooxygenase [Coccidioides immitis RS]|uniref:Flavin-binding monooxygenase n=1 Tax=Coccidioides immitis (strain RS) TaxID=246410 RepID=J3KCX2_COCIM|nr:flavin-binding monooxygenase [Coccidioides immitis RS]EAS33138.3 flavin-binding monooxygenase [Coccidioides immitis RS]
MDNFVGSQFEKQDAQSELKMVSNGFSGATSTATDDWTIDPELFAFTPRRLRVVCIGAGFAGLTLAYKLKHERPLDFVDFTIYERNSEVGGTWLKNVYPGVGCDIPSHSYVFSFEPNPTWSKFYVSGAEIQQYILNTTEKYGLKDKIIFDRHLVESIWDEEQGKWELRLESKEGVIQDKADILINAGGILHQWKWPELEGLESFKGKLIHSARWDSAYDWTGKKVAVIGNGSSGIQIVPAVQPKAAKLVNYIRHATWIAANICGHLTKDGSNFEFTEEEKQRFLENPEEFSQYRKRIESEVNSVFRMMISGSKENKFMFDLCDKLMRDRLAKNPELIEKLIPNYEIGCRRISPGDGYLEALQAENAKCCFSDIKRITEKGIETDEGEEEFDLIVCATGFNTRFIPSWKLVGRDGRRLDIAWKDKPEAYLSVCAPGIPNYFMFAGPNFPVGHGSIPPAFGWSADYMLDWTTKIATEDIKSVVVKDSVVRDYNRYAQENLKRMVWSKGCHAWYKSAKGDNRVVTAMYPGSVMHYKSALEIIRGEHFDIGYNTSNQFRFMGNGQLAWEMEEGADFAPYVK